MRPGPPLFVGFGGSNRSARILVGMDREPLDTDMGDDDQADEIREYERNIEDPPDDLRIRYRENDDDGRLGIGEELSQEWTARGQRAADAAEDDRPGEVAAVEIVDDADL